MSQILKLTEGITVKCNRYNWILIVGDKNNRSYFSTMIELFEELMELRLKGVASDIARKVKGDVRLLKGELYRWRNLILADLGKLKKTMTKADRARERGDFNKEVYETRQ